MTIHICKTAFDPWLEVSKYHQQRSRQHASGAVSVFVGCMRDFNDHSRVNNMFLEHYPGMTERQLQKIVDQAQQNWTILDTLIMHRVGNLSPADPIVLVAVWASHRGDAFDASRFLMEQLKSTAPFWKKETICESEDDRWVSTNTNGYAPNNTGTST